MKGPREWRVRAAQFGPSGPTVSCVGAYWCQNPIRPSLQLSDGLLREHKADSKEEPIIGSSSAGAAIDRGKDDRLVSH